MSLVDFNSQHLLPSIKHETLIITGTQDRLVRYSHSVRIYDLIPNSVLRFLPRSGHLFYIPDPNPTATLVNDFLAAPPSVAGLSKL